MKPHVTSKPARLGSRLSKLGQRHASVVTRIAELEDGAHPYQELIIRRLLREKARLEREMQCYETTIRTVSGTLPDYGGRLHRLAS